MTYPQHYKEHSINARKGVRSKHLKRSGITLPDKDTLKRDIRSGDITKTLNDADQRSFRSKQQDFNLEAGKVLNPHKLKDIQTWADDPTHTDMAGVDVKKEAEAFDRGRGYSGRQSAAQEVRKALGDNSDVYDLDAELDSELSSKENAEAIRKKLNPSMRNIDF
jgi:hypothetical protein